MSALHVIMLVFLIGALYIGLWSTRHSFVQPAVLAIIGGIVALIFMLAGGLLCAISAVKGDSALLAPLARARRLVLISQVVASTAIAVALVLGVLRIADDSSAFWLALGFAGIDLIIASIAGSLGKLIRRSMGYP